MITARAIGVLEEIALSPSGGAARALAAKLGEGRDAIQRAITDLREAGLVETVTNTTDNGRIMRDLRLTDAGNQFLKSRTYTLLSRLNSDLTLNTYSIKSNKRFPGEPGEGREMEDYSLGRMDVDPDDLSEMVRKERARKSLAHAEARDAKFRQRIEAAKARRPEDWSTEDSVYEFSRRVEGMWHVKPWSVARTRFKGAFASERKNYGTTGDVELKMMDRFFSSIEHETRLNDPEIIWKMFIKRFGSLLTEVSREVTGADIESAVELSDKQWEK